MSHESEEADQAARDYLMELAAALKERRLKAGLSQHELACRAGVSRSEVQGIEAGRIEPKRSTQERLVTVLGISLAELDAEVNRRKTQRALTRLREAAEARRYGL